MSTKRTATRSSVESNHEIRRTSALPPDDDEDVSEAADAVGEAAVVASTSQSSLRADEAGTGAGDIRFLRDVASPMRSRVTSSGAEGQRSRRSEGGASNAALAVSVDMAFCAADGGFRPSVKCRWGSPTS